MLFRPKLWFVALCCIIFVSGCGGSSEPTKRSELEREFEAEFGFEPPSRVQELRCKIVRVGDTWGKWMLFTLDEVTLQRVVTNGFTETSPHDSLSSELWYRDLTSQNPNAPNWWRLPSANRVQIYYKEGDPRDVAGYKFLWIDDTNRKVYAKSSAWH